MTKKQKIRKDRHTLKAYEKKLRARRQEIGRKAEVYSLTGKKQRAAAIGAAVMGLLDDLHNIQAEQEKKGKPLVDGSLFWGVDEKRVVDTDGKKGFLYTVFFMVKTADAYYTEEQVINELKDTYAKMKAETEEMYGETTDDEYLEEDE